MFRTLLNKLCMCVTCATYVRLKCPWQAEWLMPCECDAYTEQFMVHDAVQQRSVEASPLCLNRIPIQMPSALNDSINSMRSVMDRRMHMQRHMLVVYFVVLHVGSFHVNGASPEGGLLFPMRALLVNVVRSHISDSEYSASVLRNETVAVQNDSKFRVHRPTMNPFGTFSRCEYNSRNSELAFANSFTFRTLSVQLMLIRLFCHFCTRMQMFIQHGSGKARTISG